MNFRRILGLVAMLGIVALPAAPAAAQALADGSRAETGGAQTLADILTRQQGLRIDDSFRSNALGNPDAAAAITYPLGTLGGVSDAELWRALRFGKADVTVTSRGPAAEVIMQTDGMRWLTFRSGPLSSYGIALLAAVLAVLALFFLIRGRIRIDGEHTGRTVERFSALERFAHWLMAGSFIVLALTGLSLLFGRKVLIPLFGQAAYAPLAIAGKWVHNNVGWAFMLGLILVTLFWIAHNIPDRVDLKWLKVGGGLFSKGVHPPAKKFNAGQKLVFWAVLALGLSSSVSGLSLLFPFLLPLFAGTFDALNSLGLPQLVGYGELPTTLLPQQEMQLAQLWHAIVGFVFMAMIFGHIYIGTLGMEGAFDAMGSGQVEEQWAREHHSIWLEEVLGKSDEAAAPHPGE